MKLFREALADPMFHWVVAATIILGLSLATNSSPWADDRRGWDAMKERAVRDRWGFAMPPACQQDLSEVPAFIEYVDLDRRYRKLPNGGMRLGAFEEPRNGGTIPTIYVNYHVKDPAIIAAIIHHEKCHVVWWMKYGHPHWHTPSE